MEGLAEISRRRFFPSARISSTTMSFSGWLTRSILPPVSACISRARKPIVNPSSGIKVPQSFSLSSDKLISYTQARYGSPVSPRERLTTSASASMSKVRS